MGGFHAVSGDTNNNGEMNKCWWTNRESELMSYLLFTVHRHGGDDVTWFDAILMIAVLPLRSRLLRKTWRLWKTIFGYSLERVRLLPLFINSESFHVICSYSWFSSALQRSHISGHYSIMFFRRICIETGLCYWSTNMAALWRHLQSFLNLTLTLIVGWIYHHGRCACAYVKNIIVVPILMKKKRKVPQWSVFLKMAHDNLFESLYWLLFNDTRKLKQRRFWVMRVNRKWGLFHFKAPWRCQICICKCLHYYRDD